MAETPSFPLFRGGRGRGLLARAARLLFPVALDGAAHPWRTSRALLLRAGGTLSVMGTVLVLAAVMLGGGGWGRGFVRCWCLGCLAVVLWYEELRT